MLYDVENRERLLRIIFDDERIRTIYLLGATDSGKTWLAGKLAEALSQKWPTAYLDADPGQSVIGPPATVGVAEGLPGVNPAGQILRFIGSTSPAGAMLETVTGVNRLQREALRREYRRIVIDSPGMVHGDLGGRFQYAMLDALDPDCIVALGRYEVFRPFLAEFVSRKDRTVFALEPAGEVRAKSRGFRRGYRLGRFARYFAGAKDRSVLVDGRGLLGAIPGRDAPERWRHRLFALCGSDSFISVLGIVRGYDGDSGRIRALMPDCDFSRVVSIHLGAMRLDPDEIAEYRQDEREEV